MSEPEPEIEVTMETVPGWNPAPDKIVRMNEYDAAQVQEWLDAKTKGIIDELHTLEVDVAAYIAKAKAMRATSLSGPSQDTPQS